MENGEPRESPELQPGAPASAAGDFAELRPLPGGPHAASPGSAGAVDRGIAELDAAVTRERIRAALFPKRAALPAIGRYRLSRRLGEGGMGLVFAAFDPELEREVAIKVIRPEQRGGELEPHLRLLREARAIARLAHPNVVAVYDAGTHDGRVYVVMELVRGQSLREWLEQPRSWSEVVRVLLEAGRGIWAAHQAGLVHRDFKPSNVLLGDDGRVRVLDFGLARSSLESDAPLADATNAAHHTSPTRTRSGAVLGTPAYMAPEQCLGALVDERADQFSFCVSLYEALFGVRPFRGRTFPDLRRAIVNEPLELPVTARLVPEALRELLFRGLSKRPDDRYSNMLELLDALTSASFTLDEEPPPDTLPASLRAAHYETYTTQLPRGLDSYPECEVDGGLVRMALRRYPLASLPANPSAVVAIAQALDRTRWLPEAHARALLAYLADRHFASDALLRRNLGAFARARFTASFARFGMPRLASPQLANALARHVNAARRGSALHVETSDSGSAQFVLETPPHLLGVLGAIEFVETLRVTLETAGAVLFQHSVLSQSESRLVVAARWA